MSAETFRKPVTVQGRPIPRLNAKEYEDPRDSAYLNALKVNKGFGTAAKLAIEYGIERISTIMYTGSNVKVTKKNMPYLYECVQEACRILDVDFMPDVYVREDPYINAFTTGAAHPILVFNNSILHRLTHEELMFVIGHEIGHMKSEHLQYHLIGDTILRVGLSLIDSTIIGSLVSAGLNLAFIEWERRAEFTADHAGLLVCQDLKASITALAKMGGYPLEYYDHLDANDFLDQAQSFKDFDDSMYNKIIKGYLVMGQTHPWTVLRARELMLWVQSGEYSRILHRCSNWLEQEVARSVADATRAAAHHERMRDEAELAAVRREAEAATYAASRSAEPAGKKGLQLFLAKGQEAIKSIQNQISDGDVKRRQDAAVNAMKNMAAADEKERMLRALYRPVSPDVIDRHTSAVIGHLTWIDDK